MTEIRTVSTEGAKAMARRVACNEAILAGTTTGANIVPAQRFGARLWLSNTVAALIIDFGPSQFSTDVFRSPAQDTLAREVVL